MLIFLSEPPLAFYCFNKVDVQEAWPGFKILEEDTVEDDEDIVIEWYLNYSSHNMKRKEHWKWIFMRHALDDFTSPPRIKPRPNSRIYSNYVVFASQRAISRWSHMLVTRRYSCKYTFSLINLFVVECCSFLASSGNGHKATSFVVQGIGNYTLNNIYPLDGNSRIAGLGSWILEWLKDLIKRPADHFAYYKLVY